MKKPRQTIFVMQYARRLADKLSHAKRTWRRVSSTLCLQEIFTPLCKTSCCRLRSLSIPIPIRIRKQRSSAAAAARRRIQIHCRKGYSPIYVDNLFADLHSSPPIPPKAKDKEEDAVPAAAASSSSAAAAAPEKGPYSIDAAWEAVVASRPELRGVNERAEEFIARFREEMKLQKEKSMLEFQERLARSA